MERELRQALDRGEFLLHYQPILSLADRRVAGFEALIRWHHPVRGFISPALFLPSAEANGLIVDIGRWVLDEVCLALSRFRRLIPEGDDLFMSVNVSGRDIEDERFLETLDAVLCRQDVDPENVKLEITESLLMDKPDIAVEVLGACNARGLTIAIDDFGTGYSSLSYLHRFPIDTLKIDRSFVDGIGQGHAANQIIAAIIGLAKQLDLPIVAEGIEQSKQVTWLLDRGCEFGQGFHFAKLMAEPEASAFLKESDVSSGQQEVMIRPPRSAA